MAARDRGREICDLGRLADLTNRMQPILTEFYAVVDRAMGDDPAMQNWRAAGFDYNLGAGSVRPRTTDVPEGRWIDPTTEGRWTPDRRHLVELAARMIELRSQRFDGYRVHPVGKNWKDQLRHGYRGVFECEIAVGSGWADLIRAYAEMRIAAGDAPNFVQIEEKLGGLRLHETGAPRDLEWIAELLSLSVCEVCGAPGENRDEAWIRTLCDRHAK